MSFRNTGPPGLLQTLYLWFVSKMFGHATVDNDVGTQLVTIPNGDGTLAGHFEDTGHHRMQRHRGDHDEGTKHTGHCQRGAGQVLKMHMRGRGRERHDDVGIKRRHGTYAIADDDVDVGIPDTIHARKVTGHPRVDAEDYAGLVAA